MKSINLKLLLSSILVVLFSALLISIPVITIQYKNQVNVAIESGESKVSQACSDINVFLQKPISIVAAVRHYLETHETKQNQIENFFEKVLARENEFSELYFASARPYKDGGFFYANDRWQPPSDYDQTTRAWYKAGSSTQTFAISDPYLDSVTNSMVAALSTKITKNNVLAGVVGLDIQLKMLNDKVSPIKITKSGESYILDKNGKYVTNPDSSKLMKINFFEEQKTKDLHGSITDDTVLFLDNAGNGNYLAARVISEESGWIFVTTGPRKELYASVYHNIFIIFLCAIISIIVSGIVAIFAARPIITPIINVDKTINGIA
ncbi:MAG: cache domain-containing protein, partial [Treponema sp.]|nr:cache domain-containing protein [Treponema sp.]